MNLVQEIYAFYDRIVVWIFGMYLEIPQKEKLRGEIMKKLFSKVISTVLTVSLTAGIFPGNSTAAQVQNNEKAVWESENETEIQSSKNSKAETPYIEGEVIVLNAGKKKSINAFKKEASGLGAKVVDTYNFNGDNSQEQFQVSLVKSDTYTTEELMDKFSALDNVKIVQPNYKYNTMNVDEKIYNESLWGIDNQGQNAGIEDMDINSDCEQIKTASGEESKEKVVAIIDTGVDYNHEELKDYIWTNPDTTRLKGEHGYDFANGDKDPMDDNGHGTHCAGIIKSVMNDENIKIMPLKFAYADGSGDSYAAIGAYSYIYEAQKLGVNIVSVNNSWGGTMLGGEEEIILPILIDLVGENGAISVCAAGNESVNNDEYGTFPACADSSYIISVAASNEKGELATFSNYGEKEVDIAAPGTDILSTVSYENFNPSVYGEDENGKQKLCSIYQDFSGNMVTPDVPGTLNFENTLTDSICYSLEGDTDAQTVSLTEEYFGKKLEGAKALQWDIAKATSGKKYKLCLPYYQESSSTPVYLNMMLQMTVPEGAKEDWYASFFGAAALTIKDVKVGEDGKIDENSVAEVAYLQFNETGNYWEQIIVKKDSEVKTAGQRALIISLEVNYDGDYQVKLDDLAISKGNVTNQEFGKTAYMNGTSMAAPYVAGAIAAMANAYPTDSVEERIARIKGSVRKTENLNGKVATGGILDLSKADSPVPVFEEVTLNEDGNLEITGKFFQEAEIEINGKAVKIESQTDKKMIVEGSYGNQTIHMDIKMGDTIYSKQYFFAVGKEPKIMASEIGSTNKWSMTSNGNEVYCVDTQGRVCTFWEGSFLDEEAGGLTYICDGLNTQELFGIGVYSAQIQSQAVWTGYDLYAIAVLDTGFKRTACIAKVNWETGSWEKVTNIPDNFNELNQPDDYNGVILSTFAMYNGKLYVLGGFDTNENLPVNHVYVYDIETGKWSKGNSMPEARFAGKALQVGDQLIVTLGGNGTEECPVNMIFDGESWKLSKAKLSGGDVQAYCYDTTTGSSITYSEGEIGLIKDGIFYAGYKADGLGDSFSYQVKEDKYVSSGYRIGELAENKEIFGTSLGEKFYLYIKNRGNSGEEIYGNIYEMEISDGRYSVEWENFSDNGDVEGTGNYIMPGTMVEIKAVPFMDCYLKSFTVNGQKVNAEKTGGSVMFPVTSDVIVNAEFGAYVTKIELDKKKISLGAGCREKLNVKVLPENADNKSLQFKSSNQKVVTVDSKGNIKANKSAVGKSATITITAKDRKKVVAKCKVTVRKPVKIEKLELSTTKNKKTVKAGKTLTINASFTPKDADNQQLVWSSSNTKYATVKDGKVKGKKAGIGKMVTITAKTKYGKKIKASIKIKIVK